MGPVFLVPVLAYCLIRPSAAAKAPIAQDRTVAITHHLVDAEGDNGGHSSPGALARYQGRPPGLRLDCHRALVVLIQGTLITAKVRFGAVFHQTSSKFPLRRAPFQAALFPPKARSPNHSACIGDTRSGRFSCCHRA